MCPYYAVALTGGQAAGQGNCMWIRLALALRLSLVFWPSPPLRSGRRRTLSCVERGCACARNARVYYNGISDEKLRAGLAQALAWVQEWDAKTA